MKAGYAAIIGLPNAGKSTLLNSILGQKISITTNKPQTTRKRILGILSGEDFQIVFLDTPGILKPHYMLQERMMQYVDALRSLGGDKWPSPKSLIQRESTILWILGSRVRVDRKSTRLNSSHLGISYAV